MLDDVIVCIYIYIERERDVYIYIYIYIYAYTYMYIYIYIIFMQESPRAVHTHCGTWCKHAGRGQGLPRGTSPRRQPCPERARP